MADLTGKSVSRHPPTSQKWQAATTTSGLSLPAFQFQLISSGFSVKLLLTPLETTNRFDS
jgi:hypothetical protein